MTEKHSSTQIVQYRRPFRLNVGLIMFLVIFIYVLISLISYLTSHKTEVYQVRSGALADNLVYQGIALRNEIVVNSDYTGTINFYNKEGERIPVGGLAFSVDEAGKITDYLKPDEEPFLSEEDLQQFRSEAISFSKKFDPGSFANVYDFKSGAVSSAQKISNRKVLGEIPDLSSTSIHPCYAEQAGEILYFVDNCEDITFENLTVENFDRAGYKKNQITNGSRITAGEPAYKIVSDENWSVAIKVTDPDSAKRLMKEDFVEVRFLKNDHTSWASVDGREDKDGNWLINLSFTNSMENFCMDRFVDVEILSNEKKGLKVPVSSITEGEFFVVPKDYVTKGTNNQQGVLIRYYTDAGDAGSSGTQFIPTLPYSETENSYYLDNSVLKECMILEKKDSQDQYTLSKKKTLSGVYYINKGYPDFRQVTVNMQDDEYAIVEPNELYGLQEYDYIVLHADTVSFNNY